MDSPHATRRQVRKLHLPLTLLCLVGALVVGLGAGISSQLGGKDQGAGPRPLDPPCSREHPCLALVMDDIGRELAPLKQLLALRMDLSFAVLPHGRVTRESLELLRKARREVMLHLPLSPLDQTALSDETVVLGRDPLERGLMDCLQRVPDAVGINNHMGSAFSQDPELTRRLFRQLRGQPRWFLDSRTVAGSLLCREASRAGVRCVERDLFLDHHPGKTAHNLGRAVRLARERGWAIAIGHPRPATIQALHALSTELKKSGVRLRRLSRLVFARPGHNAPNLAIISQIPRTERRCRTLDRANCGNLNLITAFGHFRCCGDHSGCRNQHG